MGEFLWDGPDNSDDEIEEMLPYKNEHEIKLGVKFSKNGLIRYIEESIEKENPDAKSTTSKNAKLWENRMSFMGIKLFLKKGGSNFSSSQPFI